MVLGRGKFEDCLVAAMREYDRGASFARVTVCPLDKDQERFCIEKGLTEKEYENHRNPFYEDPMFKEINGAMRYENQLGIPAISFLLDSKTPEEYEQKISDYTDNKRMEIKS